MSSRDNLTEVVRIDGIDIPLDTVRHELRREYESATRDVKVTKASPARNIAKANLNKIAAEILREAMPTLALKASPRSHGASGFFAALAKRTA